MARPDILVTYGANTKAVDKANKQLDKSFDALSKAAAGVFAGGALISGLTAYTTKVAENIRVTNRWAKALDVPIGQLDAMSKATKTVGIDTEKFADQLKDMSEKIADYYMTGGGEAKDAIEGLSLDIDELIKLDAVGQFEAIGTALGNLDNRAQQIKFAEDLANDFTLLLPLLDDNMEKFDELVDSYRDGGNEITQSMADTTAELDLAWSNLMGRMESAWRSMLLNTFESPRPTSGSFLGWITSLGMTASEEAEYLAGAVADADAAAIAAIENRKKKQILPQKTAGKKGVAGGASTRSVDNTKDDYLSELNKLGMAYDSIAESLDPVLELERRYFDALDAVNMAVFANIRTEEEAAEIKRQLTEEYEKNLAALVEIPEAIEAETEALDDAAVSWDNMGRAAGSTLGNIVTGANAAEQALRLLGRVVEFAFEKFALPALFPSAFKKAASGMSMPGGSSLGQGVATSPTLFTFANGGRLGLMGEAGAEAILPLSRGASGNLGVEASGMSPNVNVYNYGADVTTRDGAGGDVDIVIKRITGEIARGGTPLARSLESSYGLTRGRLRG